MIQTEHETVQLEHAAVQSRPDRFRSLDRDCFDLIIIGAGTGGLTAGALLTRPGKSVLVLDRHYVAGGNATVFRRREYEFDVGIHYMGDCGPKGAVPRILRAAGVDDVTFRELDPDGFDTFLFPDFTFRVPKGFEAFRERLVKHFPSEAKGIARYVDALQSVRSFQGLGDGGLLKMMRTMWQVRTVLRYANSTVASFLDSCTHDPRLRAVLTAHSGDYAEPPSRASLIVHACVTAGYLRGPIIRREVGRRYRITSRNQSSDRAERSSCEHRSRKSWLNRVGSPAWSLRVTILADPPFVPRLSSPMPT